MITLYDPKSAREPLSVRFFHHIEARRYEWLAAQLRLAGPIGAAELCDKWAAEHRRSIVLLAEVDERVAELDAKLKGAAA